MDHTVGVLVTSGCDEILDEVVFKEGRVYCDSSSPGTVSPSWCGGVGKRAGGSWSRCLHTKEAERVECWHSAPLSFLFILGLQSKEWCCPHVRWVFPHHLIPERHAQRLVSIVILSVIKLVMKINQGWRDGSPIKNTNCSSGGPEFPVLTAGKWLRTTWISSSKRADASFWPPEALHSHVQTHTQTHTQIIFIICGETL